MAARLEVGHVQTPQANSASGCLHLLKNCTQHTLQATTVSLVLFCAYFAAKKPRAMTTHTVDTEYALIRVVIVHPDLHTMQHFQINFALTK